MKIAMTGATGYIGRVLSPLLISAGHSLRLLVRQPGGQDSPASSGYIQGDLLQEESIRALVAGMDAVIHLASVISVDDQPDQQAFRVNTEGTRLLLHAAKEAGVRRFVYISSVTAFDQRPYDERMDESRDPAQTVPFTYDHSKVLSQQMALAANGDGMEVLVLAPTAVVGPYDQKPSLLGQAIIRIHRGRIPALFPGGVDFVDVRDVVEAIVGSLNAGTPGGAYLLAGQWRSLQDLGKAIGEAKGKKITLSTVPLWLVYTLLPLVKAWAKLSGGPPFYTRRSIDNLIHSNQKIDHSRAGTELGFRPRPFAETIRDTIEWFKQHDYIKD